MSESIIRPPKPVYKEVVREFQYKGARVRVVKWLFGLSCAQNDPDEFTVYIDSHFLNLLTKDELDLVLNHEIEEMKLMRKGIPWPIAHRRIASKEPPLKRAEIIRKCGQAHRQRLREKGN